MEQTKSRYKFDTRFLLNSVLNKTPKMWLKGKRDADKLNGLWRIRDSIYDLTNFIQWHPGGQFWLEATKGTDITEAFEIHHVRSETHERLLKHFYIKPASTIRLSTLTFDNDGFYKKLKKKVEQSLKKFPNDDCQTYMTYTDTILILSVFLAVLSSILGSFVCAFLAGFFSALTITAAHKYIHQRNNIRMYYSDLLFIPSSDLRVIHVLSHHIFTNTDIDNQMMFSSRGIDLFQNRISIYWWYGSFLLWPIAIHGFIFMKFVEVCATLSLKVNADLILPLIIPFLMIILRSHSIFMTVILLNTIIVIESFAFFLISFATGHNHPGVHVNEDATKNVSVNDWGIHQLCTISDKIESDDDDQFLTLVTFGDHALHHLFPTLDRSTFHHLYPVIADTLKEFNVNIKFMSQMEMLLIYFTKPFSNLNKKNIKTLKSD